MFFVNIDLLKYALGVRAKHTKEIYMVKDNEENRRAQEQYSAQLEKSCYRYLFGLLAVLDRCLDRRLVETFLALVLVVIMHRHLNQGLLLSELGGI